MSHMLVSYMILLHLSICGHLYGMFTFNYELNVNDVFGGMEYIHFMMQ